MPTEWFVEPFIDSFNEQVYKDAGQPAAGTWAAQRQPISGSPNVTIGLDGHLVLDFGTGDTNNIGTSYIQNYVYSVSEKSNATTSVAGTRLIGSVNWYDALPNTTGGGEMITGPATVFDGVYYFATYAPPAGGGSTCATGSPLSVGVGFVNPAVGDGLHAVGGRLGGDGHDDRQRAVHPARERDDPRRRDHVLRRVRGGQHRDSDPVSGGTSVSLSDAEPASYWITRPWSNFADLGRDDGRTNTGAAVKTATYNIGRTSSTLRRSSNSWASIVE